MDLRNILEKFLNAIACIFMSDVNHQICYKFMIGELQRLHFSISK